MTPPYFEKVARGLILQFVFSIISLEKENMLFGYGIQKVDTAG